VKAGGLTLASWSWLAVTVNFGGLTLALWSWLAVIVNFGGLTLVVSYLVVPRPVVSLSITSVNHDYLITYIPSMAVFLQLNYVK
jgi:hypothetical protein